MYRVGPFGAPFDSSYIYRFGFLLFKILPFAVSCYYFELLVNFRFDHAKYGIKPKHRILGQHPMINDALPNRILSGTVMLKGDIQEFTENGIIFKGDDKETEVDAVVLATGYEVYFPFLDKDLVWAQDNEIELYKCMFVPKLKHAHTLCIIGLIQAFGPAIPISEIQVRWFCELMLGGMIPLI
ncbi:dimethylaniline monooxygenase [N-oxide-forming] 5-like protein [Leptotrombidium deliense]|uniref:Flavin-containing monooxygenase n=1 Tax=Leptotrombidium deliense TaxID=299467 RepID=A0A443RW23_9ACAR|nr:dimethylaniline monooxygenase [N-oxide-forming] 5-like protein [Leptotrombidium deliense]